ncbi:Rxt3p [Nakaseomyces bracarensis]|uniref:Rxt3p n=1 Tax=Nakaseomyces bracarensis TaxID=273131 RepID=UPI0038727D5A
MDDAYKATQSQIYSLQETLLDSNKNAKRPKKEKEVKEKDKEVKDKDKDKDKEVKEKKPRAKKRKGDENVQHKRSNSNKLKKIEEARVYVVSESILDHISVEDKKFLGTIQYDSMHEGVLNNVLPRRQDNCLTAPVDGISVPFPFNLERRILPVPFMPEFSGDKVYSIVTVRIKFEDYMKSFNKDVSCPRTFNNEIWGCDVYTDDTDPILALRHCGFTHIDTAAANNNNTNISTGGKGKNTHKVIVPAPLQRTPVNIDNKDNVTGEISKVEGELKPFDLEVDLLLLPRLQQYFSVKRYGINSRHWGSFSTPLKLDAYTVYLRMSMHMNLEDNIYPTETASHDGISYGIHKIVIKQRDPDTVDW